MTELKSVKWIMHDVMIRGTPFENTIEQIVRDLGHEYFPIKDYTLMADLDEFGLPSADHCVIPYCTLALAREMKKYYGMYMNEHNLQHHVYTSLLDVPHPRFLNWNGVYATFKHFRLRKDYWFSTMGADSIFIRPTSGIKLFAGHTFKYDTWDREIAYLETTGISDESFLLINWTKCLWDETRFIICGGKVVDGSRYATDNGVVLIEDKNYPPELTKLAEEVCRSTWLPDEAFVLDLCMTFSGPKIVEINSVNCAGWYAIDPEKAIRAISNHTLKIWNEQYG